MKLFIVLFVASLILSTHVDAQEIVLAGWTFPGSSTVADTGIIANLNSEISTIGGTSAIDFKNGFETKAAQATGWNDGMDLKAWVVTFSTHEYTNLNISSRQQSGGNEPGPKYFRLQYSIDAGFSWTNLNGGEITVENDWEMSFVDQLLLPEACDNKDQVMIRWLMSSNEASGSGGNVLENGKSKIDEIFIRGEMINSFEDYLIQGLKVFAGISTGSLRIQSNDKIESVIISSLQGQVWMFDNLNAETVDLTLSTDHTGGIVIYRILWKNSNRKFTGKLYLP